MQLDHEISGFRVMAFMYLSYTYPSVNNVIIIVNLGLYSFFDGDWSVFANSE